MFYVRACRIWQEAAGVLHNQLDIGPLIDSGGHLTEDPRCVNHRSFLTANFGASLSWGIGKENKDLLT